MSIENELKALEERTLETRLVGETYFEGAGNVIKMIALTDNLELVRQPENPHDPNAIGVFKDGQQLGFIPKQDAALLIGAELKYAMRDARHKRSITVVYRVP